MDNSLESRVYWKKKILLHFWGSGMKCIYFTFSNPTLWEYTNGIVIDVFGRILYWESLKLREWVSNFKNKVLKT